MQPPHYVGSSAARLIVAMMVFVVGVVAAVFLLTGSPRLTAEKSGKNKPLAPDAATEAKSADHEFFYDVVGQAPAEFGESTEAEPKTLGPKLSYTLEIKVATSKEEAEQLIDLLHDQGVDAYYTPMTRAGKVVYRVRRGIFKRQQDANRAMASLKSEHNLTTRVVKLQ